MNFRSNCFWNWINCGLDYPRCHLLRSPLNNLNDEASFVFVQMDLCWHAAVAFVVVPISVGARKRNHIG